MEQSGRMDTSEKMLPVKQQADISHAWCFISGSTLKMIAVVTMLTDHFAAGVLGRYLSMQGADNLDWPDSAAYEQWMEQNENLMRAYNIMRDIGRVAFPIYCFLLVEGFIHTKNRMKYAGRLLVFAFISEIPFDLLFRGKAVYLGYQNVFFTLFFGMLAMIGMEWAAKREIPLALKTVLTCVCAAACMAAAKMMLTDYAELGVLCVVIMFLTRKSRKLQIAAGSCSFLYLLQETAAPWAFLSIALYNGKRGWNLKYFFYLFYPVHLLLLYLLCQMLGIAGYSAW